MTGWVSTGRLGPSTASRLNVNGSSLAVGHPFAATGARIVATLAKLLEQRGSGRGLISICTAGGMGVTAILERSTLTCDDYQIAASLARDPRQSACHARCASAVAR